MALAIDQDVLRRRTHGILKSFLDTVSSMLTMFVERQETDLQIFALLWILFDDALDRDTTGIFGPMSQAHLLDDEMRAADLNDLFAETSGGSRVNLVVHK